MRVSMYSTPMDGSCGIGIYTSDLSSRLKDNNVEINHVTVDRDKKNPLYYLGKALELSSADIVHVQYEYDFVGRYPVIGTYVPLFYSFLKLLSILRSFEIVTTMHGVWDSENPPREGLFPKLFVKTVNRFLLKCCDSFIALSEDIYNLLIKEGTPKDKVNIIPHGSRDPEFLDKAKCKEELGVNPEDNIVTIFGYIRPSGEGTDVRGHDLFIEIAKSFPQYVFLVAGTWQTEHGKKYMEELERIAPDNVWFYGFVEDNDIPKIMNATDVMVLPYRRIKVSGVANFAMAYQIPTIASDLSYFEEIKNKYGCVETFEAEDIEDLVSKIMNLDNNKVSRLIEGAKEFQKENSWSNAVKKHLELYKRMR